MKEYAHNKIMLEVYADTLDALKCKRDSYASLAEYYSDTDENYVQYMDMMKCMENMIDTILEKINPLKY